MPGHPPYDDPRWERVREVTRNVRRVPPGCQRNHVGMIVRVNHGDVLVQAYVVGALRAVVF